MYVYLLTFIVEQNLVGIDAVVSIGGYALDRRLELHLTANYFV